MGFRRQSDNAGRALQILDLLKPLVRSSGLALFIFLGRFGDDHNFVIAKIGLVDCSSLLYFAL